MNVVVLQGVVREEAQSHTLASGEEAISFELFVRSVTDESTRVPVVAVDPRVDLAVDDELIVVGGVRKRFFRGAGGTQSRTEVLASRIVPARRKAQAQRAIDEAVAVITAGDE